MHLKSLSILALAGLVVTAAPAFATPAQTNVAVGFSSGPGTDYGPTTKLPAGAHLEVIWCGTHANWCLVEIHHTKGWVPLASIDLKKTKAGVFNDNGTPSNNTASTGGGTSGGGNGGSKQAAQMATEISQPPKGGGGSGITFTPVNNYNLVKP